MEGELITFKYTFRIIAVAATLVTCLIPVTFSTAPANQIAPSATNTLHPASSETMTYLVVDVFTLDFNASGTQLPSSVMVRVEGITPGATFSIVDGTPASVSEYMLHRTGNVQGILNVTSSIRSTIFYDEGERWTVLVINDDVLQGVVMVNITTFQGYVIESFSFTGLYNLVPAGIPAGIAWLVLGIIAGARRYKRSMGGGNAV